LAPRESTPWQSGRGTHCTNSPGGCHTRVWRLGRGEYTIQPCGAWASQGKYITPMNKPCDAWERKEIEL
jgi:hypothetical protein